MEKFKASEEDKQLNMDFKKWPLEELMALLEKRYPDVKLIPGKIIEDGNGGFLKDGEPIDYEGIKRYILQIRDLDKKVRNDRLYNRGH